MTIDQLLNLSARYATFNSSAVLCHQDACSLAAKGDVAHAKNRAIDSLKHSVGIMHPAYKQAMEAV